MLRGTIAVLAVFALAAVAPGVQADNYQEGGHSDCLDNQVFWALPIYSPVNPAFVLITPGAAFTLWTDEENLSVWIDFYDEDDGWIGVQGGASSYQGSVPADAAKATVCISSPIAGISSPDARWFYNEG